MPQSDKINEAFEAWWQRWREQNGWPNTQRMRDAGRSVYEALAYSNIDAAVEQLRAQGHLNEPASAERVLVVDDSRSHASAAIAKIIEEESAPSSDVEHEGYPGIAHDFERMRAALEKIERWFGEFPATGRTWDDGSPMSYGAAYGSNGERDYMRGVARAALADAPKSAIREREAVVTCPVTEDACEYHHCGTYGCAKQVPSQDGKETKQPGFPLLNTVKNDERYRFLRDHWEDFSGTTTRGADKAKWLDEQIDRAMARRELPGEDWLA